MTRSQIMQLYAIDLRRARHDVFVSRPAGATIGKKVKTENQLNKAKV
jgi:hypothetical protein